jgi:threonine synthase
LDLRGLRVVAVCTGHGLKDPNIITSRMPAPAVLTADLKALEDAIL